MCFHTFFAGPRLLFFSSFFFLFFFFSLGGVVVGSVLETIPIPDLIKNQRSYSSSVCLRMT